MAGASKAVTRTQGYAQIYNIVNQAGKIVIGKDAPTVQDSASLVALGVKVLQFDSLSINFIGTLFAAMGKTIIETRKYKSKLSFLMYDDFEWGAIVEKIDVDTPDAVEDVSLDLMDGKSVDMYVVAKPTAKVKFFYNKSAYTFFMTIQRKWLKDAFRSAEAMGAFLSAIETKMRNKLERANETQGRLTLGNLACLTYDTPREIKLLTEYNTIGPGGLTPVTAMRDAGFLRFMSETMQDMAVQLESNTTLWNAEGNEKFTNANDRVFVIPSQLSKAMKANVLYDAFHADMLSLGKTVELAFWTSPQRDARMQLMQRVNTAGYDDTPSYKDITIDNLAGIMFDRRAAGTYRTNEEVSTTPYNSRGRYTNTFWHEDNMWFNDLGEQAVIFTVR